MECINHSTTDARFSCSACNEPLCLQCTVELANKTYCKKCLEKMLAGIKHQYEPIKRRKKSKFLTFMFGLMPGAGYMYLGLINKGLYLMSFFLITICSIIFIENLLFLNDLSIIAAPLAILSVFYSVFDSLAIADDINSGKTIYDSNTIDFTSIRNRIIIKKEYFGYIFLVLGGISILNLFVRTINSYIYKLFNNYIFDFSLSKLIMALVLIGLGIYLIRKK